MANKNELKLSEGVFLKISNSLSTDSTYYKFYDKKGRTALIRTSDHDSNLMREPADIDLPVNTSIEQIIKMGEDFLFSKPILTPVFLKDEVAGYIIDFISDGKYGKVVNFKNSQPQMLHAFESSYNIKVKDRTREEERKKLFYKNLFLQLEEKGLFIHRGILTQKFKKENYPVFISDRYYVKSAIPFSEKNNLDKYKKYNNERFYVFYISKTKEGKSEIDNILFYKETYPLIPYLNFLVEQGVLVEPRPEDIQLPDPFVEDKYDKELRLKWEEINKLERLINSKTHGMIAQKSIEFLEQNFSQKINIPEVKLLIDKKNIMQKELKELKENKINSLSLNAPTTSLTDQFQTMLHEELKACEKGIYPKVCSLRDSERGFELIFKNVYNIVSQTGMSIGSALAQYESTL